MSDATNAERRLASSLPPPGRCLRRPPRQRTVLDRAQSSGFSAGTGSSCAPSITVDAQGVIANRTARLMTRLRRAWAAEEIWNL